MKKLTLFIVMVLFLPFILSAQNGLTVSFRGGQPANGTNIGFKIGPFQPYIGADFYIFGINVDEDDYDTDWDSGNMYHSWEYRDHTEVQTELFLPHIGLRFYLMQSDIKVYLLAEGGPGFPKIYIDSHGYEKEYNPDGSTYWEDEWDDEFKLTEDAEDYDMGRLSLGFGAEYELDTDVMIGGEFGFRFVGGHLLDEGKDEGYYEWDQSEWRNEWKHEVSGALGGTYTNFTLSFYF